MKLITKMMSVMVVLLLSSALLFGQSLNLEKKKIQVKQELSVDAYDGVNPIANPDYSGSDVSFASSDPSRAVLYDNGPLVTHPAGGFGGFDASGLQSVTGPMLTLYGVGAQQTAGNSVADDFLVTGTWTLSTIKFYSYQTGSTTTSTITGVYVQVWNGAPNAGGTVVWGDLTTNRLATTTWSSIYRSIESSLLDSNRPIMEVSANVAGCVLAGGTYWVQYQLTGTLASGPWAPPVSIWGQGETGNAIQLTSTGWAAIVSGTAPATYGQGMPFIIEGTAGAQPNNDLAVTSILTPSSGSNLTSAEPVTIRIQNLGLNAQSNFPVSYTLNGGAPVNGTVTATIPSLATYDYTFATTANLAALGTYTFHACANLAGDQNAANNCFDKVVEHVAPSYCAATTTTEDEYISNVTCGAINNTSGWQGGVADYTALFTTINAGASEAVSVTNGTPYSTDMVTIWVDWNHDFTFGTGDEQFVLTNVGGTGASFSGSIAVPAGQANGDYRMRIRLTYSTAPAPCGSATYGEVEDYTVNVGGGTPTPAIQVSPMVLTQALDPDQTATQVVTVTNTGTAPLTFDLAVNTAIRAYHQNTAEDFARLNARMTADGLNNGLVAISHGKAGGASAYQSDDATIRYDDGVNADAIGLTTGGTFQVAAYFPTATMGQYAGQVLKKVEMYINTVPSPCKIKIYGPGSSIAPGTLLYEQTVVPTGLSWNLFELNTPVPITGQDLWIAYEVTHAASEYPCGCDNGPAIVGYGDMISTDGVTWDPLSSFGLNYNWNLVGYVGTNEVFSKDVGVQALVTPVSGVGLGDATVKITVKNYGTLPQSNIPVSYTIDGGAAVNGTIAGPLAAGATFDYTFAGTVNLGTVGHTYVFNVCTSLTGDENPVNNCKVVDVKNIPPFYCDATTTTEDEYIANVSMGTINNSSGWQGGVADYTDQSTTIEAGFSQDVVVTNGNPWAADIVYIWVDWNMDYTFGTGDEQFALISDGTGTTFTGAVAVPAGTPEGDYRMRIRMTYSTAPVPCGSASYGEVEDYTVHVGSGPPPTTWLTAEPLMGTVAAGQSMNIDVTFNSAGLPNPSVNNGSLVFTTNAPATPTVTVPATLTVPAGTPPVGIIFEDDFEAYTAGEMVACQNPDDWTTWSNTPCGADDAYISDLYAHSGVNSVVIVQNDDLVKDFGDPYTTGKYSISFYAYIPTGKTGYFNTLQEFIPTGTSVWGLEVYFNAAGAGSINATGTGTASFTWTPDNWFKVEHIIDLDQDHSEIWIGGNMIYSYQWSLGATGTGQNTLDANDFFGAAATDQMFFDDYKLESAGPPPVGPEIEVNPTSVTQNVNVNGTADSYIAISNTGGEALTYAIEVEYPTDASSQVEPIDTPEAIAQLNVRMAADGLGNGVSCNSARNASGNSQMTASKTDARYQVKKFEIRGTTAYSFVAYDPSAVNPIGPAVFDTDTPGTITSLAPSTSSDFIAGGSWADGVWYGAEYGTGALYTIDPSSGAMSLVGTGSAPGGLNALAYDVTTATMYGCNYGASSGLYTVNLTNGATTLVGDVGAGALVIGMACDASGNLYAADLIADNLLSINKTTGAGTVIGPLGVALNYAQDLEYDNQNDVLYLAGYTTTGQLFTINPTTGVATLIGNFQGGSEICGLAFEYSSVQYTNDVGVQTILSPVSGPELGNEIVKIRVKNYGTAAQSNIPVSYTLDGGAAVNGTVAGPLAAGATFDYTFAGTVNLGTVGQTYVFNACTSLAGDENAVNNCKIANVTNVIPAYCDASTTTEDEYISNVTMGLINNSSGWQGGVADYTAIYTEIAAGASQDVTVTNGNAWTADIVYIWVDWNENYTFEGGDELTMLTNVGGTGASFTGAVAVPATQGDGMYRMRIRMTYSTAPTPCGNASYGEIEDYTVKVIGGGPILWLTVPTATGTVAPGATENVLLQFDAAGLVAGTYHANLAITNNSGNAPMLDVPVTMNVGDIPQGLVVNPMMLEETHNPAPQTTTKQLTVTNNGATTVNFDVVVNTTNSNAPQIDPVAANKVLAERVSQFIRLSNSTPGGSSPNQTDDETIRYDDGVNADAIGLTAGGTFQVAAYWPAITMAQYAGMKLNQVEFYINDVPNPCKIKIYGAGTPTSPGTLLHEETVTPNGMAWNIFLLSSEVDITGEDLWIGYEVTHAGGAYPAGCDAGPAIAGYGDMITMDGVLWAPLSSYGLNYNWNLVGYLIPGGPAATNDVGVQTILSPVSGPELGNEVVTIRVKNFGTASQSNIPVSYTIDGGAAVTATVPGALAGGATIDFTFSGTVNMSNVGQTWVFNACTALAGDEVAGNNCKTASVTNVLPVYCDATTSTEDEYISNVLFGSINNSSGWQGGVADYTAFSTTIAAGESEDMTVTNPTPYSSDMVYVWVDWNMDYVFNTSGDEQYVLTNVGGTGASFTGAIMVPAGQDGGDYRMRIRLTYSTAPTPCGSATYGEIEDYTLNVEGGTPTSWLSALPLQGTLAPNQSMIVNVTFNSTNLSIGDHLGSVVFNSNDPINPVITVPVTLHVENGCTMPAPMNLEYAIYAPQTVHLTWEAPETPGGVIRWDDGVNADGIGLTSGGTFAVAARWTADQLLDYVGLSLTSVDIFPRSTGGTVFTLKIWKGANAATLLHSQLMTGLTQEAWNSVTLSANVVIPAATEFWIGYECGTQPAGDYPAGCDAGPAVAGFGDMISMSGGAWAPLSGYGLNYNWNIAGTLGLGLDGLPLAQPIAIGQSFNNTTNATVAEGHLPIALNPEWTPTTRELMGYNVYRDGGKINGTIIGVNTLFYNDVPAFGNHYYYVTGVYPECESASATILVEVNVGIDEIGNAKTAIYPNPATNFVNIESGANIGRIMILNNIGQVVYTSVADSKSIQVNTSDFRKGIYFIQVETANGMITEKLIIQ